MLSIQRAIEERISRKPIVDHIIEALSAIQQMEEQPDWDPLFDPSMFVRSNSELVTADYEMNEEDLRAWCVRGVKIRKSIDQRVEDLRELDVAHLDPEGHVAQQDPEPEVAQQDPEAEVAQ